uniref:Uncharacterized protein n=1 Tax=Candidatus Kentrum sp. TC TaxID=2126339 RepID=A0A450ZMF5_9GAMM|nr:MAG: hypothetical protein BECKTC1821E_GA0114239_100449 [Candidatus Kentron sp. TC]VFK40303.1 MAG: hypothetical protein BECKTC1821D_GA0114238_100938 [Candidatus Kentron sp. TC]VFK55005.1 MAG: hypothetical protein BECKTC1821F_GA0114240_100646 [Candidatus Kentron sp. TC]
MYYSAFSFSYRERMNDHFTIVYLINEPIAGCPRFDLVRIVQAAKPAGRDVGFKKALREFFLVLGFYR